MIHLKSIYIRILEIIYYLSDFYVLTLIFLIIFKQKMIFFVFIQDYFIWQVKMLLLFAEFCK